jgi:hypothetical protein
MVASRARKLLVAAAAGVAWGGSPASVSAADRAPVDARSGDASPLSGVAGTSSVADAFRPFHLMQDVETIYDVEAPPAEDAGFNAGGVNFDLSVRYLTDHVFRGIDRSEGSGGFRDEEGNPVIFDPDEPDFEPGGEDAANLQLDGRFKFDLGRAPSPFAGLFANVYNDDPISRFQEIRPYVGVEWMVRPFIIAAGQTTYIFPEREDVNTAEVWASVTLDDSIFFRSERPVLAPYVMAAYDYDLYDGFYLEAGVKHEVAIEDTPITLTFIADAAFVVGHPQFTFANGEDTGFQHYDLGVVGRYNLNTLFNVSRRYGTFHFEGYLWYTDGIDDDLLSDSQLWGGAGIGFRY